MENYTELKFVDYDLSYLCEGEYVLLVYAFIDNEIAYIHIDPTNNNVFLIENEDAELDIDIPDEIISNYVNSLDLQIGGSYIG